MIGGVDAAGGARGAGGRLPGRVAIVTGGASGIGAAIARRFAAEGAAVAILDRDETGARAVAEGIESAGGRALAVPVDLTLPGEAERAIGIAAAALGVPDVLVTAAGIIRRQAATDTTDAEWDQVLAINLTAVFRCCRAVIPLMAGRGGTIVTIGSGWGLVGGPRAVSYAATKAAVVNLTRALAIDHGPDGIRVNCLCPGDVETPLFRDEARQLGADPYALVAESAAGRPLRRVGTPEEIAAAALFLASDESSYLTGSVLVADGGGLAGG